MFCNRAQVSRIISRAVQARQKVEFVLVPFNDVGYKHIKPFGPLLKAINASEVNATLQALPAFGGGKPEEMCYPALLEAVKEVQYRTPVFVFTEDISKEEHLEADIMRLAKE